MKAEISFKTIRKRWKKVNGNYNKYLKAVKKFIKEYLTHGNNAARGLKKIHNQGNPSRDAKEGNLNKHYVNFSITRAMYFGKVCSGNNNGKAEKVAKKRKIDQMLLQWPILFLYKRTRMNKLVKEKKAKKRKKSDAYDDYVGRKASKHNIELEILDREYAGDPDVIILGKIYNSIFVETRKADIRLTLEALQKLYPNTRIIYFPNIPLMIDKDRLATGHNLYSCVAWMIADFFNNNEKGIDIDDVEDEEL